MFIYVIIPSGKIISKMLEMLYLDSVSTFQDEIEKGTAYVLMPLAE